MGTRADAAHGMNSNPAPTYTWPKYLLAAVILGIVIAVLAVMKEANRVKNLRGTDPLHQPASAPSNSVSR